MADYVYELMAKIGLDDESFKRGLKETGTTLKDWGKSAGKMALKGAKIVGAGIAAGAAGVAALTKNAVESYAEYEQLVGGVETLFGTGGQSFREFVQSSGLSVQEATREYGKLQKAQDAVMAHAAEAYKTAGLSANEYMETVTSFSASLIQSLGGDTVKAAEYADKAIVDMSDNANKMGTDMGSIQAAYQGFAKQNYTMLDNLKLGYGGTKTEMERLILDAEKLDGNFKATRDANGDLTMSYADIVDAIHIVQNEMGITGTTAKEASTTISGSIGSMKAAWANLVTGLADSNADLEKLIDNFIETIIGKNGKGGVINNLLPAIKKSLNGITKVITTAVPKIIPIIVDVILENLPQLIAAGTQILVALITGLIQALPQLIEAIPQIFEAMKTAFIENWPALKEAGAQLLHMIGDGILSALGNLDQKLQEVGAAISAGLDAKFAEIKANVAEKWDAIKTKIADTWDQVKTNTQTKWNQIKSNLSTTWQSIKDTATRKTDDLKTMLSGKWEAIKQAYDEHGGGLRGIAEATWQGIKEYFTLGYDTIDTLTGGKLSDLKDKVTELFGNIKDAISEKVDRIKDLFNFEWSFPHIRMPHFSWYWEDVGGLVSIPRFSVDWYKKAYDQPWMFTKPTLAGFGDGNGGEMVYGHESLMRDIREATGGGEPSSITVNVYPQKGQSETEIANAVQKVLVRWDKQRKAASMA